MLVRPNMVEYQCTLIELSVRVNITRDELSKLLENFQIEEEDLAVTPFVSSYKAANRLHSIEILIHKWHKGGKEGDFHALIDLKRGKPIDIITLGEPREAIPLLNFLVELKKKNITYVRSSFEYNPQEYKSRIDLPIRFELVEGKYSEIRGLRFIVKQGIKTKKSDYSHIIDLNDKGIIIHRISFNIQDIMTDTILEDALRISSEISKRVIVID